MISTLYLQTKLCMRDGWLSASGVYWACSSTSSTSAKIHMSKTGGYCPSGEGKYIKVGAVAYFGNGAYKCTLQNSWEGTATVRIEDVGEEEIEPDIEPNVTKVQIPSIQSDKIAYAVGDIIKSECTVKNIGGAGTVYLTVGLGYIDSSDMIFLTGFPVTDQLFLNYQQMYTFREDIKVDITDYYRQRGIGWAYLQQQMYLFFLVGHKENGADVWDTERHLKTYIDEPEEFKDPTDLDESTIGDIGDTVGDIGDTIKDGIPAFGGLGGLKWAYDKTKDIEHIPDWIADKLRKEPEEEQPDLMPFIYIGFAGLIGYLLVRSQ